MSAATPGTAETDAPGGREASARGTAPELVLVAPRVALMVWSCRSVVLRRMAVPADTLDTRDTCDTSTRGTEDGGAMAPVSALPKLRRDVVLCGVATAP